MITQFSLPLLKLLPYLLWVLFHAATAGHISIQPRIIGGWDAPQGRFPYMTSLLDNSGIHQCGGSLIAPDVVLTAAHCLDKVATAQVGRYNRSDASESYDNFQIVARYVHPRYVVGIFSYDFMLLKLSGSSSRQVLALNHNDSVPSDGQALTVMGFGLTQMGNLSSVPSVLQEVTVNVISNTICGQAQEPGISQNYVGQITPDMLCADASQRDACQGDSGGPLIVPGNSANQDVQVGHVSWGLGCALAAFPGVYARTSYAFAWIASTVCAVSSTPPTEFRCQDGTSTFSPAPSGPPSRPTVSPAPTGGITHVTVVIYLDSFPSETGWSIEDATTGSTVINVPSGSYNISGQTVVVTVAVHTGRKYIFIIKDSFGDGIQSAGYRVVLGSSESGTTILLKGSGHFLFQAAQDFVVRGSNHPTVPTPPVNTSWTTPSPSPAVMWDALEFPTAPGGTTFLTVEIQLDQNPEQTSWRLDSLGTFLTQIARVQPGSYSTPFQVVQKTVEIKSGRKYVFTVFDEGQNGIDNGYVRLFSGPSNSSNSSLLKMDHGGDFGPSFQFTFKASDSTLQAPTSRPLGSSFLTLELRFDLYPNETSVVVEANDNGKIHFLFYRPPGYYTNPENANQVVYEYVVLPQTLSNATVYTLSLIDTFSDGLCCAHNGNFPYTTGYSLYEGSESNGLMLVTSRFKTAPKEETSFFLPFLRSTRDLATTAPRASSFAVQVTLGIQGDPAVVGYYIQDASGSRIVDRGPGSFSLSSVSETIPLIEGLYYFGLAGVNGGGFNGTYEVRLTAPLGISGRPPILSGLGSESETLHQPFLVEGFDSSFSVAILIETDNYPNQTGFYLERLDLNGTTAIVAQVPTGSYNNSHAMQHEPLLVHHGGLYRLVMLDSEANGMDGRIYIVLGGTDLDANAARVVTIYGTSFESQGYYTFLALKDESAYSPPTDALNLTLRIQFDVLPMGVDWALLSDMMSPIGVAPALQTRMFQGMSLVAFGPQTPTGTDYVGREMVETILLPQIQGLQTFTLSMAFRVNELCCPMGLSGSYELYDTYDLSTTGTPMLLSQGHFSNAQFATTVFTLSSTPSSMQSAAPAFSNRRRRILWLPISLLLMWPFLYAISDS